MRGLEDEDTDEHKDRGRCMYRITRDAESETELGAAPNHGAAPPYVRPHTRARRWKHVRTRNSANSKDRRSGFGHLPQGLH